MALSEVEGSLVEVQDSVVEKRVADFKDDVVALNGFRSPAHHPIGAEIFDSTLLALEFKLGAQEDAAPDVLFDLILNSSHLGLVEVFTLGDNIPVELTLEQGQSLEKGGNVIPAVWELQSLADMLLENSSEVD